MTILTWRTQTAFRAAGRFARMLQMPMVTDSAKRSSQALSKESLTHTTTYTTVPGLLDSAGFLVVAERMIEAVGLIVKAA